MDGSIFLFIYITKIKWILSSVARSPKSLTSKQVNSLIYIYKQVNYLDLARKDCTALGPGPGSEGNELGCCCFSSTQIFLPACASRAISALLSSYSSLDGSDGLRRSFPTKIEKAVSHRDVDSFSAPNEMGDL
jgi:hypothetical protein